MKIGMRIAVLLIMLLLVACVTRGDLLTFVVIPAEDAAMTRTQWQPAIEYLSEGMGREIELLVASDYTAVIEAMRYGHADIARLSPAGYVIAINEGADIEPIAVAVKRETGLPGYYSMLIALAETDVSDLSALTLGLVDVGSTSGGIIPSAYLDENNIKPKGVLYAGSHNAVILAVKNGSVDIGAVASNRLATALEQDVLAEGEIKIVWQSDLVPNCPIAIQSSMSQTEKDKLTMLFLNMPEDLVTIAAINESGYVKADDATYDSIRDIARYKDR